MLSEPGPGASLRFAAFVVVGLVIAALALYLRLRVFLGLKPGGVDTWYYLASAEAIRQQRRLPIRLPQYLLHDRVESYPAIFPLVLALLPPIWLRRYFWLLSPLIDAAHLVLLYVLSYRLTDSLFAAATAGLIYAVTPQLISETRNLNGRAFASLLQTLAMVWLLRTDIPSTGPSRALLGESAVIPIAVSLLLIALLFNTHTSTTIAFLVSVATLSVMLGEPRFLVLGALGLPAAIVLSGGFYLRVIANHLQAARFWIRNVHLTRAHQVEDSPVLGPARASPRASAGLYGPGVRSWIALAARLLGENPFILAMLVTPIPGSDWGRAMYWWAVAILVWAVATTFVRPLRILGPGFHYMKASVFPTAYALAVTVNVYEGAFSLVGATLLLSFILSIGALLYFYRAMAERTTEHTAQTPPDLAMAADFLRALPGKAVLVLPNMYADFVAFHADKAVVWGGHSGNLSRLEEFFPVLRRPLAYFFERYDVDYLLLDHSYTTPERLKVSEGLLPLRHFGPITLYEVQRAARSLAQQSVGTVPVGARVLG